MARDKVDALYDELKSADYVSKSREHFRKFFLAPGAQGTKNRQALYDELKEVGYLDIPTYDEFTRRMGLGGHKPAGDNNNGAAAHKAAGATVAKTPAAPAKPVDEAAVATAFSRTPWNASAQKAEGVAPKLGGMSGTRTPWKEERLELPSDVEERFGAATPAATGAEPYKPGEDAARKMEASNAAAAVAMQQTVDATGTMLANQEEYMRNMGKQDWLGNVPSRLAYDPTTGRMERTVVNAAGERRTSEEGERQGYADKVAKNTKFYEQLTLSGQIRDAERRRAELADKTRKMFDEMLEETKDEWFVGNTSMSPLAPKSALDARIQGNMEYQRYLTALKSIDQELQTLRNAKDNHTNGGGFWRGFGRGTWQAVANADAWDFGVGQAKDAINVMGVADKLDRGQKLDESEEALLESLASKNEVAEMYAELGTGYRWGNITGTSLSFMKDFIITGGFSGVNGASMLPAKVAAKVLPSRVAMKIATSAAAKRAAGDAAAKALATRIGKEGIMSVVRQGGKGALKKAVQTVGVKGLIGSAATKAFGVAAEDLLLRAPLMTATVQGGNAIADVINTKYGNVYYNAEAGKYEFVNDKEWGSAAYEAIGDRVIENASEMVGGHFLSATDVTKLLGARKLTAAVLRATRENAGTMLSKTSAFLERAGVHGFFGEVGEEYVGQAMRTALGLESAYGADGRNNFFDERFHVDIWGGMMMSVGLTGGVTMGAGYALSGACKGIGKAYRGARYLYYKNALAKSGLRAADLFAQGEWEEMQAIYDNADTSDLVELADAVRKDASMSEEQRRATMDYIGKSFSFRGYNLGEMLLRKAIGQSQVAQVDDEVSQAMMDGYEASTPQEMQDAENHFADVRRRAEDKLGAETLDRLDGDPVAELLKMFNDDEIAAENFQLAKEYVNARAMRDGVMQRVNDDIEAQVAQSDGAMERLTV